MTSHGVLDSAFSPSRRLLCQTTLDSAQLAKLKVSLPRAKRMGAAPATAAEEIGVYDGARVSIRSHALWHPVRVGATQPNYLLRKDRASAC
jgi:hypothetical protein